uniref:TFIIS N-terminal domain-containing protein n=1 Tax=Chenopodium quinoa TaxID=63459 RepID=A0A803NC18_CHEQI
IVRRLLLVTALFKPAKDTPPFVGVALKASPNEVFYSFYSDEIPAASLLHLCKVAFLPKGVKLPPGVSSFVCRRVYDITSKCLWWLTDQDYIDERKEEVYQLLHKSRIEMHASVEPQQGPRSPRPVNGSAATSPLKHSPDSVQNSSSNPPSHRKGKKRERGDQSFDAIKRERSLKPGDGDSGQIRSESTLNSEIAKFAEKGGLVDSDAVVRLVRLMQPDKSEKKIDLTGRSMLASIIAATDKLDCLDRFVQLRGLHVLNEWLQEVHKGKIGDSGNIKHNDKFVDDFLLVLLRALDKLPVNLNALQMCNIGKSVNHLRSHKNFEIQKKARSLVDTWKKRVEAEMNVSDVKPSSSQAVPWPSRSQHDSSHGGNRHSSGYDAAIRSSVTHHSSLKSASVKPVQGDSTSKSASAHPGGLLSTVSPTSATDNYKDGKSQIITANDGSSEPQSVAREEKSSSSSQSQSLTNSQCSSDHAKNFVLCGKEDTKKSTAGSRSLNKTVGSSSKHREHVCGPSSNAQQETASNKSSYMGRNSVVEKVSHNVTDASVPESNSHKLIVKISNRGRGPAQSIAGGYLEDSSCRNSRASSPALLEKHDLSESAVSDNKHDSHQLHEVDEPSSSVHQRTSEIKKLPNVSNVVCSSSSIEHMSRKIYDSSFSSMNALIESCAKLSEANMSMLAGDDVGMNLLASVAAGEIPKTGVVSPLHGDDAVQQGHSTDDVGNDNHSNVAGAFTAVEESSKLGGVKNDNLHPSMEGCLKNNVTLEEKGDAASPPASVACTTGMNMDNLGAGTAESRNRKVVAAKEESQNELPVASRSVSLDVQDKIKVVSLNDEFEKKTHRDTALYSPNDGDEKNIKQELLSNMEQKSLAVTLKFDSKTNVKQVMVSSGTSHQLAAEVKSERTEGVAVCALACQTKNRTLDKESETSVPVKEGEPVVFCADIDQDRSCKVENAENKDGSSARVASCTAVALSEAELHSHAEGAKLIEMKEESKENSGSAAENVALSTVSGGPDTDTKLGFDLNEGFNVDEGKNGEPSNLGFVRYPDIVCSVSPFQIPVSPASCGLPASITVAAAAKGPFVPSDDLLWNKGELGWKGSAATSAFRPAEPRKSLRPDSLVCRPTRFPLDIDLNVADESSSQEFNVRNNPLLEPMTTASLRSSGGLDLDLNKVDEASDMTHVGRHMASNIQRFEAFTEHVKPSTANFYSNGGGSGKRDFDLNDGPETEELPAEQVLYRQLNIGNIPLQPPFGPRINSSDTGNCFSWYTPGTSYSVSMTPSVLPEREAFSMVGMGGGPQRVVGGPTAALSFNPDVYSGSVLSSSPALPFHPAAFQYPVLPFGNNFPLPTSSLASGSSGYMDPTATGRMSAIPSQLVGNAAAVSFQYPHAYVVSRSIPDTGNNSVIGSNHKWRKQGLDLNCGPGVMDVEGKDESLPIVYRQVSNISSQTLADEQARMYSMGGGHMKRKEPEGGWNVDKLNLKQSSWR